MTWILRIIMISLCVFYVTADDIERGVRNKLMLRLFREMVNQTKADTLDLPANATSIRENITDTFSCRNRTYGYYADVDNECQIFHVCLTSLSSSGRSATYRWSFICPNETIFNQEILTCMRPRDSIDCEDSPMYYDVNMEIGKTNVTEQIYEEQINKETATVNKQNKDKVIQETLRRKPSRKQNLIMEMLDQVNRDQVDIEEMAENQQFMPLVIDEVKDMIKPMDELGKEEIDESVKNEMSSPPKKEKNKPTKKPARKIIKTHDVGVKYGALNSDRVNARLASEKSIKRRGRTIQRGSFRFKADE